MSVESNGDGMSEHYEGRVEYPPEVVECLQSCACLSCKDRRFIIITLFTLPSEQPEWNAAVAARWESFKVCDCAACVHLRWIGKQSSRRDEGYKGMSELQDDDDNSNA